MNIHIKEKKYSIATIIIALVFWFFDTSIHYFVYGEPHLEIIPEDFNELWMRSVIVILIIFFGIYADLSAKKLLEKEKELEATRIYNSMIFANHHILNNLLNKMQLFKMEALRSNDFDQEIIELYDRVIDEASDLIKQLSTINNISDENILASIAPKSNDNE